MLSIYLYRPFRPLVSQDPENYRDAPTEGIRRILEMITGTTLARGEVLRTDKIGAIYSKIKCVNYIELSSRLYKTFHDGGHQRTS
jgi:hypothetical protein